MFPGERRGWMDTENMDELVLKDSEVRVAFLEREGAEWLDDVDMVARMRLRLGFLII